MKENRQYHVCRLFNGKISEALYSTAKYENALRVKRYYERKYPEKMFVIKKGNI